MKHVRFVQRLLAVCASAGVALGLVACKPTSTESQSSPSQTSQAAQDAKIRDLERAVREAQQAAAAAQAEAKAAAARSTSQPGGARHTYEPKLAEGYSASAMAFPSGDPASSPILLHLVMPDVVNRNQMFEYEYHVTNTTNGTLQNVILSLESMLNLDIKSANPKASVADGRTTWTLGDLGPRETRVIKVQASAAELGVTTNCIGITYNNQLCAGTEVVEPALALVKTAPTRVILCDGMEFKYVVRNPGTGVARNVQVTDQLPAGLRTSDGKQTVSRLIGDLGPGESAEFSIEIEASRTGSFASAASASAGDGLSADSRETTTAVVQPVLQITASCPETRYIGRAADFEYTIKNIGDAESVDTVVVARVPAGSEFVSASSRGTFENGTVTWQLGTLAVGGESQVSFRVRSAEVASLRSSASVAAYCAAEVSDNCITRVIGIPAILLEVVDLEDPIEVGSTETYVITVTNQGSAADTNIQIVCTLPAEQTYVSSSGATRGQLDGRTVTFAPLASLGPKQEAEWRVVVRAEQEGDVRFTVRMTSDELTSPVQENEATNLYR